MVIFSLVACGGSSNNGEEAHVHTFSEWEVTREPTCVNDGTRTKTCSCGEKQSEVVESLSHNYVDRVCTLCGDVKDSEGLAFALNSDGVSYTVTGLGTCVDANVGIPKMYNGCPVTAIGDYALGGCENLTSVKIPDSVTIIGYRAFFYCENLTTVTIPDSVTTIGLEAFDGCFSLTSVKIPDGVTTIGYHAFFACSSLTNVTIPDSVTTIGERAFDGCKSLTSVTIPDSVTTIGEYAFAGCESLTSVTIPDSVTTIGNSAFAGCENLTSVTIGNSVTTIGYNAFYYCKSLTSVIIGNSVTSIGYSAFSYCDSLKFNEYENACYLGNENNPYLALIKAKDDSITDCTIHKDTKIVCSYAFEYCSELAHVTIPDSVIIIDNCAFFQCESLTSVTIPDSVTTIGDYAFSACFSLTSIEVSENNTAYKSVDGNIYTKDGKVFVQYANGKNDTSFSIPDGVTTIGNSAFHDCDRLASVKIPDSVTTIGSHAFDYCYSLTSIEVSENNTAYKSIDGNLYTIDGKVFVQYASGKNDTSFTIPDGVTTIGEYAFSWCESLTNVTIPDSVTTIGSYAFDYCSSLTSITFEDTSTWYITESFDEWENMTGGEIISVEDPSVNAEYLLSSYPYYYWYKK